jgi:DNA-binding CsgD family transcriptional regulator
VERTIAREPDYLGLARAALRLILEHLGVEKGNWYGIDPATHLQTFVVMPGFLMRAASAVMLRIPGADPFQLDMDRDRSDPLSIPWMLDQQRLAFSLHAETGGDRALSRRYREFFDKVGAVDELRVRLTYGGHTWSLAAFVQEHRPFTSAEVDTLEALAPVLGRAQRICFLRAALNTEGATGRRPGLLLLDEHGRLKHVSDEARELLPGVAEAAGPEILATLLRPLFEAEDVQDLMLMTETGPLTAHATTMDGLRAVIIERAEAPALAPQIMLAYGLSQREREVVEALCRGLSTREMAAKLDISEHTVKDHCKSIFDKMGVNSRKEVVARLATAHYRPQIRRGARPGANGWFA